MNQLASLCQCTSGTVPLIGRHRLIDPAISTVSAPSDPPDRALSDRMCLLEGFPPPRVFRRSQSTGADAIVYRPSAGSGRAGASGSVQERVQSPLGKGGAAGGLHDAVQVVLGIETGRPVAGLDGAAVPVGEDPRLRGQPVL